MSLSTSVSRAGDDQANLFLVLPRDLPDDARELVEDLPERNHSDVEDAVLELARGAARSHG